VLGISDQTVKSHLHRIYEQTATKRQADLVKLVASLGGETLSEGETRSRATPRFRASA
jgi:hypothetical protein